MLGLKLSALLCFGAIADAASNACTASPNAALAPLALLPTVQYFCSSKYPVPPVTSTSTSRTTTTSTTTLTSTTSTTTTTTTTATVTETEEDTVTVTPAAAKRFIPKRQIYADAKRALLDPIASILALPGAGAASYCSCIETPKTTTTTVTSTSTIPASTTTTTTNTFTSTSTTTTTTTTTSITTVTATPLTQCPQIAKPYTSYGKTFNINCGAAYVQDQVDGSQTLGPIDDFKTCIDLCAARSGCVVANYRQSDGTCQTFIRLGTYKNTGSFANFDAAALQGAK